MGENVNGEAVGVGLLELVHAKARRVQRRRRVGALWGLAVFVGGALFHVQ
jgi:hypothetical protein